MFKENTAAHLFKSSVDQRQPVFTLSALETGNKAACGINPHQHLPLVGMLAPLLFDTPPPGEHDAETDLGDSLPTAERQLCAYDGSTWSPIPSELQSPQCRPLLAGIRHILGLIYGEEACEWAEECSVCVCVFFCCAEGIRRGGRGG